MKNGQKGKRRGRKIPNFLTAEEQEKLLKQPNPRYKTGLRNLCIMRVILQTGLRVSEVINLKVAHVNWMSGEMKVVCGKGNKDRITWINEDDLDLLKKMRNKLEVKTDYLFPTLKGTKLSDRYLRQMVKRYARKAGIITPDKGVHPHTLRHTYATDLYRETNNILYVQKTLGHSQLSTTLIYTHIVDVDLENTVKNFRMPV